MADMQPQDPQSSPDQGAEAQDAPESQILEQIEALVQKLGPQAQQALLEALQKMVGGPSQDQSSAMGGPNGTPVGM